MLIWYEHGVTMVLQSVSFIFLLKWRDHFLLEYFGEGGEGGCVGTINPPPGQQVFLHGQPGCIRVSCHQIMLSIDCHNNTFLAMRTINDKSDNVYAQFYLTGN